MVAALLAFALPAVLSHFGVGLLAPVLANVMGAGAATAAAKVVASGAAKGVRDLLAHVAAGHDVTPEQRTWLQANRQELQIDPKFVPGQDGPPVWGNPKG